MGGSEAVTEAARTYFFVRIWSAPFALGNYVVLGWLVGLARTGIALALQIAMNVLNMAVTALLVLVFDLGIAGAALAAVIAEVAGLAAGLVVIRVMAGSLAASGVLDPHQLRPPFAINRDI